MPDNNHLQIAAATANAALTPTQKRFNTLVRQTEQARRQLADWQANIPLYQQAHRQVIAPLLAAQAATSRRWIAALDALSDQPGWSRIERQTLGELLRDAAGALLTDGPDDAELRALYDKHGDVDFETERAEALRDMKSAAEVVTGLDLGDDDVTSDEELLRRMQQGLAAQAEAASAAAEEQARAHSDERMAQRTARRPTAAQRRREADVQQATQSVREIYRKLASALHPDRETDDAQRAGKTALMQQVNQAYAANDLLALLELQLRTEQVDAARLGQASDARLKHYNQVLAEQLDQLKAEVDRTKAHFAMDFGLPHGVVLPPPDRLIKLIDAEKRELLFEEAQMQRDLRLLRTDRAVLKRWLKLQRQALRAAEREDDGPW